MNRMPCRISDDPSYDYSDYCEGKGYYAPTPEEDPDAAYDIWKSEQPEDSLNPPHVGDKNENHQTNGSAS